jgi:Xaa-Pro aminopeptidase
MRYSLPVFFFLLLSFGALAQWDDTDRLSKEFHQQKRDALRVLMPEKSAAVFFANPVRNRNNDVDFQFSQNPNFYYLTGYLEPNAALIILKEPRVFDGVSTNEILFVQDRNPTSEIWTGKRLGVDGAKQMLGFKSVYKGIDLREFGLNWSSLNELMVLYPSLPNRSSLSNAELGDLVDYFQDATMKSKVVVNESGLKPMMNSLREIKTKEEIGLMQTAMDITIDGFKAMIKQLEPGMSEYEAQAIIEYYSKKGGSEYMGYPSICGGGSNACVLHYTYNRKSLEAKDMFLVDMGAEYHGYTADITRTIPVDGNFSTEEKAIYNLVLQAQNAGIEKCRKGNDFRAGHNAAYAVIAKGLIDLGIIKKESEAKNYFMHGTSHYLGLDVHDAGTYQSLLPGVVMTVEPGIYINQGSNCDPKWWGIGVRIEDDILVTDTDPVIMTISLPRSIEELEKMMAE